MNSIRIFIFGSAFVLAGWLTASFVSKTDPASGEKITSLVSPDIKTQALEAANTTAETSTPVAQVKP